MATSMARGAAARGRPIAFGDGRRLIWGPFCEEAFRHNPNIARSAAGNVEWVHYYKGKRGYSRQGNGRWIFNFDWKCRPGEFFFDAAERSYAIERPGAVLLEPNVPWHKSVAVNKDWGLARWQQLANLLRSNDIRVYQTSYGKARLSNINEIKVVTFRQAAASISGFPLVIVPEGGLHHAAAAVGTPAIVIFGGFVPPAVLGYDDHINLTGGAEACGSWTRCRHCREALDRIEPEHVYECARSKLYQKNSAISCRAG